MTPREPTPVSFSRRRVSGAHDASSRRPRVVRHRARGLRGAARAVGAQAIEQLPFALWESYARVFRFAPAVSRSCRLVRSPGSAHACIGSPRRLQWLLCFSLCRTYSQELPPPRATKSHTRRPRGLPGALEEKELDRSCFSPDTRAARREATSHHITYPVDGICYTARRDMLHTTDSNKEPKLTTPPTTAASRRPTPARP